DNKVAAGGWYYTATFDDLSNVDANGTPRQDHGTAGAYVVGDAILLRSKTDPRRRLAGFVEAGLADARVNRFGSYVGAGSVATGPVPTRPADELGVAIAIAHNGSGYLNSRRRFGEPTAPFEAAIELTYLAQIASRLAVQPDFQYVIHPNTDAMVPNGRAFQLRFEVAVWARVERHAICRQCDVAPPDAGPDHSRFVPAAIDPQQTMIASPDAEWVAYTSDESGRQEVDIQRFPDPRDEMQIRRAAARRPDG